MQTQTTTLPRFPSIIITGASSGIGAALAKAYAQKGVTLGLIGRNRERLEEVAVICEKKGATCICGILDLTDTTAASAWLKNYDLNHPVDLVIANAGISGGTSGMTGETEAQVRNIFKTNLDGTLNTILPLIPLMRSRGRGHLALVSSLAGLRGLPGAPAYSASKGVVRLYGEGLRADLKPCGIDVSVICPGFVKTPMTDINNFPMPFLVSADKAATIIKNGLYRRKARIAFPWRMYVIVWLLALLPVSWIDALLARLPAKAATPPHTGVDK